MYGDKTFNDTKEELAKGGYSEIANNTFENKYGEKLQTDGQWAREDEHSTWKKVGDEDNPLHKK